MAPYNRFSPSDRTARTLPLGRGMLSVLRHLGLYLSGALTAVLLMQVTHTPPHDALPARDREPCAGAGVRTPEESAKDVSCPRHCKATTAPTPVQDMQKVFHGMEMTLPPGRQRATRVLLEQQVTATERPPLAFIHVGKTGGTSFDAAMQDKLCPTKMVSRLPVRWCEKLNRKYFGHQHYDYSYMDTLPVRPDVLMLLRHPVDRAISHFYFSQTLSWTENLKMRHMTLTEYLHDPQEMLLTRHLWCDGCAAVAWLTGVTQQYSVWPNELSDAENRLRERVELDTAASLYLAAGRLRSAFWVGISEDLSASLKRLSDKLGVAEDDLRVFHERRAKPRAPEPDAVRQKLAALMPGDIWLYEYAKSLVKDGPELARRPPLPNIACRSTTRVLQCDAASAMGEVSHLSESASKGEGEYHFNLINAAKRAWEATDLTTSTVA